jgi:hypothetical protein
MRQMLAHNAPSRATENVADKKNPQIRSSPALR